MSFFKKKNNLTVDPNTTQLIKPKASIRSATVPVVPVEAPPGASEPTLDSTDTKQDVLASPIVEPTDTQEPPAVAPKEGNTSEQTPTRNRLTFSRKATVAPQPEIVPDVTTAATPESTVAPTTNVVASESASATEAVPPTNDKPRSSFGIGKSLFGKKEAQPVEEEPKPQELEVSDTPKKAKTIFGIPLTKADAEAVKAEKKVASAAATPNSNVEATSTPATKASSKNTFKAYVDKLKLSSLIRPKELIILTETPSLEQVKWRITDTEVTELYESDEDPSTISGVLSFSMQDKRYAADPGAKSADIKNLVLSNNGESFYINKADELEAIYASSTQRLMALPYSMAPGLFILEAALRSHLVESDVHYIIGANLVDAATSRRLLILYYRNPLSQEYSQVFVAVNPTDVTFTMTQFAMANKVEIRQCKIFLLDNKNLQEAVSAYWHGYPQEAEFHGFSLRKLAMVGVSAVVVASIGTTVFAGQAYYRKSVHLAHEQALKTQIADNKLKTNTLISNSVIPFSKTQQVPIDEALANARFIWQPGTTLTLEVTPDRQVFDLKASLVQGAVAVPFSQIKQVLNPSIPDGCTKQSTGFNGAINEVKIQIQCEVLAGPFSSYRLN